METLQAALTVALLSLPRPQSDEPPERYRERVGVIAEAIVLGTRDERIWTHRERAAAVGSIFYGESTLSLEVHSGRRMGDRGRAACLGQVHQTGAVPKAEWNRLTGTDLSSTRRCVVATMRVLRMSANWCHAYRTSEIAKAFGAYATGNSCGPTKKTPRRVARWRLLLSRLNN